MNSVYQPSTFLELESQVHHLNLSSQEIQRVSNTPTNLLVICLCQTLHICILSEPPGKVIDLRVTDSTYTTLSLSWTKPTEEEGVQDEAKGYFVELRPAENPEWGRCNSNAIIMTSYTIMGLKSMAMYWVRVVAANEGGDGEPQDLENYIIAMPPPGELVKIRIYSHNLKPIPTSNQICFVSP